MEPKNILELKEIASLAARDAGIFLSNASSESRSILLSNERDIKIRADQETEKKIRSELKRLTGIQILGEESQTTLSNPNALSWIVDPLDGTANYANHIPIYCVSIALVKKQVPLLGVIYDPLRNEMFCGGRAIGSTVNGQEIRVGIRSDTAESILATGIPTGMHMGAEEMQSLTDEMSKWKKVRMIGSAALSLAWVAAGRIDAYWERGIWSWDVLAGLALVEGASGYTLYSKLGDFRTPIEVYAAGRNLTSFAPFTTS